MDKKKFTFAFSFFSSSSSFSCSFSLTTHMDAFTISSHSAYACVVFTAFVDFCRLHSCIWTVLVFFALLLTFTQIYCRRFFLIKCELNALWSGQWLAWLEKLMKFFSECFDGGNSRWNWKKVVFHFRCNFICCSKVVIFLCLIWGYF